MFLSPRGFHFGLEPEVACHAVAWKQKIQGFTHFLTSNKLCIAKQWQTPLFGRQTGLPSGRQCPCFLPAGRQVNAINNLFN